MFQKPKYESLTLELLLKTDCFQQFGVHLEYIKLVTY